MLSKESAQNENRRSFLRPDLDDRAGFVYFYIVDVVYCNKLFI